MPYLLGHTAAWLQFLARADLNRLANSVNMNTIIQQDIFAQVSCYVLPIIIALKHHSDI